MTRKASTFIRTIALLVALALAPAAGAASQHSGAFHADIDTGFGYSQGECCYYWYYGTPTRVTVPRIGPAVLTTYFIQCLSGSIYVCNPQYSDLLLTFEAHDSTLTLEGYAPNIGVTAPNASGKRELDVAGTWTVLPGATGRFADFQGSGTFTFALVEPFTIGGTEHISLRGSLSR